MIIAVTLHRLRRWKRQRLNRAVIASLDSRLRADIGLPPGPSAPWLTGPRAPSRV